MPKKPTKASDNEFCIARLEAASFNDRLSSREGASEELGIDRTRLAKIELGSLNPYPEEVLMMADCYNAPELESFFCSTICPIGKKTMPLAEMRSLDRLTIRTLATLATTKGIEEELLNVAQEEAVDSAKVEKVMEIAKELERVAVAAQELQIWARKNLKGGGQE